MGEGLQQFIPLILVFAVFYFFLIAPQRKRQKQEKQYIAELKKGDRVVTISGMHGKVLDLNEDGTCIIETGAGKIKFDRSAISMEKSKRLNAPAKK